VANDIHNYLSAMIGAAKSKSGDELLVFGIEQVLAGAQPRQAEILRRCAVPRWIDLGVLELLRGSSEGNERIFDLLRNYSFVRDLGDGRLMYHDQVRATLLDHWEREDPAALRDLHQTLYTYFGRRTTPAGGTQAMPLLPESSTLRAIPARGQADLLRREALYHLFQLNADQALAELRSAFDEFEASHRLAEAELLLQAADAADLQPDQRDRLQFMQARVLQAGLSLDDAGTLLEQLHIRQDLAADLRADVARALGEVYAETGRWARATGLYRQSLAYYVRADDRRAAAEIMLLLGEAYQSLGLSTGSWHVPTPSAWWLLRGLHNFSLWLLGLPFRLIILVLGSRNRLLPLPAYCARYQNWLLIRLYNTARIWYRQARQAFQQLGDEAGMLRAEQRLCDILLIYGYTDEAQARIERLMERPAARDPYRRAWLQRSLAECRLAVGAPDQARRLLADSLRLFRDMGDVRREAVVMMLNGRAAASAGDADVALESFRDSLERFRVLRYATARERILHDLRAWQRRLTTSRDVGRRIDALIDAEPEKRYVGRFIRRYQPLLQVASLIALPLALLITAMIAPTTSFFATESGVVSLAQFYDPVRIVAVLGVLLVLYLSVYAGMALALIVYLPLSSIEQRQPDLIVTDHHGIARYNSVGDCAQRLEWGSLQRWLALDRCFWERPLPLYSQTFLEDRSGRDLVIDGITGWYSELQRDLGMRLAANGSSLQRHDLGYRLLRSVGGGLTLLGLVLLLLIAVVENRWLAVPPWFPAEVFALLKTVGLGGVFLLGPIAYWMVTRPLQIQRMLLDDQRWPTILVGLGALPIVLYLVSGGRAITVAALNYTSCIWGFYVLSEALSVLFAPTRRRLRAVFVSAAMLIALVMTAQPLFGLYLQEVAAVATNQSDRPLLTGEPAPDVAAICARGYTAASDARDLGADAYLTYMEQGHCAANSGRWDLAAESYRLAVEQSRPGSSERVLALYNLERALRAIGVNDEAIQVRLVYRQICLESVDARDACNWLQISESTP
jgi:tetratricopeptide (TPR) repeat protein